MAKTSQNIPRGLQKTFVVAAGLVFVMGLLMMTLTALMQYQTNTNLSAFYWLFISQVVLPIVLLLIAYLFNPRQVGRLQRLFESFIVAAIGIFALQIATQAAIQLYGSYSIQEGDTWFEFVKYELWATGIVAVLYVVVLWVLRSTKRWK